MTKDRIGRFKEAVWGVVGISSMIGLFLCFCIGFKSCQDMDNMRRSVPISGQITSIYSSYMSGFRATLTRDSTTDSIPLTVIQANKFRVGDVVKVTVICDGWGNLIKVADIEKIDLPK